MLEKKKLRDIAESMSGKRPENRSLEGIVNFIEKEGGITYEKEPRTFLGRLRELGYALNGVRPKQRSLRGIVNEIYNNFIPVPPTPTAKIYGVSGLTNSSLALTRTDDAVGMGYVVNDDATITSDFDNVFPFNEFEEVDIVGDKYTNTFVKIPAMWFRIGVGFTNEITDIAVSKEKGEGDNWYQTKEFYYGKYQSTQIENELVSSRVPPEYSIYPIVSKTIKQFRELLPKKQYFQQLDLYHKTIMNFLWLIEFGTKNANLISMYISATNTLKEIGSTDSLPITCHSGFYNNQIKWHFIEDFGYNVQEVMEGVGFVDRKYYATSNPDNFSNPASSYTVLSYSIAGNLVNGCLGTIGWDHNNPFLCLPVYLDLDTNYNSYFGSYVSLGSYINDFYVCGSPYDKPDGYTIMSNNYRGSTSSGAKIGTRLLYCPNGV